MKILIGIATLALLALPTRGNAQSALPTLDSLTANNGFYSNRIPLITPQRPYTEVCFVEGSLQSDVHAAGELTNGGNCAPGDPGWIIERQEREADDWPTARADCLLSQMRLPEPFEWVYSCKHRNELKLEGMIGNPEWASNNVNMRRNRGTGSTQRVGASAHAFGKKSCTEFGGGWIGDDGGNESSIAYRCVR